MNPFHKSLEAHLRGRHVRVVSNDGVEFHGWIERLHHSDRHVALRDARNIDRDEDVGAVMVAHADTIEVLEPESQIESVSVDAIEPSPFASGEWEHQNNAGYIDQVRDRGFVGSFPVVREVESGLQVVEGHKRFWVCQQAGLDTHPVEIVDVDDWTATRRFVADHLPLDSQLGHDGYYDDEQVEAAVDALVSKWGDRVLELERVATNVERLGIVIDVAAEVQDGDAEGQRNTADDGADTPLSPEATKPLPDDVDDDGKEDDEEFWCGECGFGPSSKTGVAIHQGQQHGGKTTIVSDPDDVDVEDEATQSQPTEFSTERLHAELLDLEAKGETPVAANDLAQRFDVGGRKVGAHLRRLNDEGAVEKANDDAPATWRPTPPPEDDHSTEGELQEQPLSEARDEDLEEPVASNSYNLSSTQRTREPPRWRDYSASTGSSNQCQHCGEHVDPKYDRVFEAEDEPGPRCCPNCEDLIREADGQTVREKRYQTRTDGGVR